MITVGANQNAGTYKTAVNRMHRTLCKARIAAILAASCNTETIEDINAHYPVCPTVIVQYQNAIFPCMVKIMGYYLANKLASGEDDESNLQWRVLQIYFAANNIKQIQQ